MADYEIQGVSMTMTLASGTALSLDEDDIMLGSVTLDDSSSTATDFQLGTAIAKKLSFELNNFDDRFSDYDFVGAVVSASLSYSVGNILASANATVTNNLLELPNAHVDSANLLGSTAATEPNGNTVTMENGIVTDTGASIDTNGILTFGDGTLSNRDIIGINGGTVTAPVGVFYVVEKPVYNGGTIAFTALDCICLTDRVWQTSLTFPTTLQMIYNEICEYCDVPHLSQSIPNGGYVVQARPAETTITCADMLCYISQLCGGFAHTDADGNLCIMQYGGVLHSLAQSFTSEIDTDDIVITGVSAIECFDETDDAQPGYYVAGSAGYVLAIAENPLVQQGDAQKAATFVNSVVHGMKFRPMHLTIPKDPTIHAGDAFIFTDRKGNQYGGYATTVSFNTNDVTTVEMDAKSPTEHNSVNYSSTTKTMSEVRRLTGTDAIFDRIYARGINADFINTGSIRSLVSGFGFDLDDGSGNIGGWMINGDELTKTITWSYPANTFTAADASVCSQAAAGNLSEAAYQEALLLYDVNKDGELTSKDTSIVTRNANGEAFEFSRTVRLQPDSGSPIYIETTPGNNVTKINGGTVNANTFIAGSGTSSGSFKVYYGGDWFGGMTGYFGAARYIGGICVGVDTTLETEATLINQNLKITNGRVYTEDGYTSINAGETAVFGNGIGICNPLSSLGCGWVRMIGTSGVDAGELEIGNGCNGSAGKVTVAAYNNASGTTASQKVTLVNSTAYINKPTTGGGTATSVATSSWTTLASVTHGIGTFLIIGFATFPSNATGRRSIRITTSASSSTAFHNMAVCNQTAVNGESTQASICHVHSATSTGTWYLRAWQNSGSALSTTGYIQIIQIGL